MSQLSSLHRTVFRRAVLVVAALTMTACTQYGSPRNPGTPLPPPGAGSPGGGQTAVLGQQPYAGQNDAVLSGVAYLASGGNAQVPPGSKMTVRVYDSRLADVNRPVAEKSFTSNGQGLPWSYELRVPIEAITSLGAAAVAGRIEGPDGKLLYLNDAVVNLREGAADDIPMIAAGGGSQGFQQYQQPTTYQQQQPAYQQQQPTTYQQPAYQQPSYQQPTYQQPSYQQPAYEQPSYQQPSIYQDYEATSPNATPTYGVPDVNQGYGLPRYDQPVYQGQTYGSPSLSGPPSNTTF